jgi:hypothetical protein
MTNATGLHRRADGSIDTSYYMEKGRICRGNAAHEIFAASILVSRRLVFSVPALIAIVFLAGSN